MRRQLRHGALHIPEGAKLLVDGLPGDDIHRLGELVAPVTLTFSDALGNHDLTFVTPCSTSWASASSAFASMSCT